MIKDRRQDNGKKNVSRQETVSGTRTRGSQSSTRKYDAEKYLNRLFKNYKARKGTTVYWVREGYFKVEVVLTEIFTTEYWIEKY